FVGAGSPAKRAARWMAPASPVFAGKPAPTGTAPLSMLALYLWERACPRRAAERPQLFIPAKAG
ncbi:hypothetical protein EI533_37855, partial [Pseudomonas donghuensis]|nr:hypothetical protein [Pseudomonas donghuensis]